MQLFDPVWYFACHTPQRVPFSDWYIADNAYMVGFQARSVVGGFFMKMLSDPQIWKKWALRGTQTKGPWAALSRGCATAGLAALLSLAAGLPAAAQDAAVQADKALTKKCLDCHDDPKVKTKDGKSMQVVTADFRRSAHRKVECVACHEASRNSKHPDEALGAVEPKVCVECHEDQIKEVAGSIHGKRAAGKKAISVRTLAGWAHDVVGDTIEGFQLKRIRSGVETLLAACRFIADVNGR